MTRAPGPTLTTQRLILRPPDLADVGPWSEFMGSQASSFIGGPVPRLRGWGSLMSGAGEWALRGFGMFSVVERESGRWVGRVGPVHPEGWPGTEVGWAIIPQAQGQGYAFEAAVASMQWVVEELGWTDIIHTIHPDNFISQRLARKLGSTNSGIGRLPPPNEDHSVDIWRQSAAQWRAGGLAADRKSHA
jgi:RimJ/RimL family protein N-acetyltransferase